MEKDRRPRPPVGAYVIRGGEIRPGWVLLYACTAGLGFIAGLFRGFVALPVVWVTFLILDWPTGAPMQTLLYVIAWGPLALSLVTLLLPLGGWLWQQQTGGRSPSGRERLIYDDALQLLKGRDPQVRAPRRWFVLDDPLPNAAVYADTLMLTRGLIDSGHLEAVLAHELGHLNSSDSRLAAALHRMTTQPRRRLRFPFATVGFLLSGALPIWVTRVPWASYWRAREFAADDYAAKLGQGTALARFLTHHALDNDVPVPFIWLSPESHPYSEHRLDKLYRHDDVA
jgi:Zn-dependent protease with chaperone function